MRVQLLSLEVADCVGYVRKPLTWIESPSSPSLKSRWRSPRVSRNWKRPRQICTRRYKPDETEVCRSSITGLCRVFSHKSFLDMAAGMERLSEYKTYNSQFCKRIFDYLSIMFTAQVSDIPTMSTSGTDIAIATPVEDASW